MTGYLQRLFDRGGGDAPMPSAPSMSPVAQADQRLTVPGIGDALMWQAPTFALDTPLGNEASLPDGLAPSPATPRRLETPVTRPEMPITHTAPSPAPIITPPETAKAPAPLASPRPYQPPAIPTPIRQVGAIDAGDLELPADPDAAALPTAPQTLPKAEPAPVAPVTGSTEQAINNRMTPEAEPVRPSSTPTPALDAASVDRGTPPREAPPAQSAPVPEPETPRLAEPAPPAPMLAMPVPLREPPPLEVAPPVQIAPPASAPKAEPRRIETIRAPEPARPPRPLTANEVSVIGPLPASRRSATMFGVRRR